MKKLLMLCMENVEEIECLTVVDFVRRAGVEVTLASIMGKRLITGGHGIEFKADTVLEDVINDDFDAIVLPGGAGTHFLKESETVLELVRKYNNEGKLVAAICAAPGALAIAGVLDGKTATVYPTCEEEGYGANWVADKTYVDGNVITGKGPGAANLFALELIGYLLGEDKKNEIGKQIQLF